MSIETPPELSIDEVKMLAFLGLHSREGEWIRIPAMEKTSLEERGFIQTRWHGQNFLGRPTQAGWAVIAQEALVGDIERAQVNVEHWENGRIE